MRSRKKGALQSPTSQNDRELFHFFVEKLRSFRKELGLSRAQLAKASGISVASMYKIEKKEMVPTLTTSFKIVKALQKNLSDFLPLQETALDCAVSRRKKRGKLHVLAKGIALEPLTPCLSGAKFQGALIHLGPQAKSYEALAYEGEQLIVVLQGSLLFEVNGEEILLRRGDSLHYKSSLPHCFRNPARRPALFLVASTPPLRQVP